MTEGVFDPGDHEPHSDVDIAESMSQHSLNSQGMVSHTVDPVQTTPLGTVAAEDESRTQHSLDMGQKQSKHTVEVSGADMERKRPLQLLDLPIDILRSILKEITHTNDLAALALTHSALHGLVTPDIYTRFDIVWPENEGSSDTRTGVDALTYGLSTLVMSGHIFREPDAIRTCGCDVMGTHQCTTCGKTCSEKATHQIAEKTAYKVRRGNYYAQYVKKFSLGNGPSNMVLEYLISKENGKMLGTLVALAVARMHNLESFVWDMPTGILRDVWLALSSIAERYGDRAPRFEKVWVRCHDNKLIYPASTRANQTQSLLQRSKRNIEQPSYSILPPMRSISVLDIDEIAYLDELSVLVERSLDRLRELRIGAASMLDAKSWPNADQGAPADQDNSDPSMGCLKAGGLLGMLMGKFFDCRKQSIPLSAIIQENQAIMKSAELEVTAPASPPGVPQIAENVETSGPSEPTEPTEPEELPATTISPESPDSSTDADQTAYTPTTEQSMPIPSPHALMNGIMSLTAGLTGMTLNPAEGLLETTLPSQPSVVKTQNEPQKAPLSVESNSLPSSKLDDILSPQKQRKLRLENFELEKVPINVSVLQKTIDWTVLTSLTLLHCEGDEELWRALKRTYAPRARSIPIIPPTAPLLTKTSDSFFHKTSSSRISPISSAEYRLKLKRIHTNHVSLALISFLRDALAPNSLEWMFLQDTAGSPSKVPIDAIYKGPLRRHKKSLKKVMIDGAIKRSIEGAPEVISKKWMLNREILTFVTSGKMQSLRELAIVLNVDDWHFFLQTLPQIPHLRSLHIPYIHGLPLPSDEAKELANQIVDIVTLRSEIQLCYLGIFQKCFEILETKPTIDASDAASNSTTAQITAHINTAADEDSDVEDDDDDDEEDGGDVTAPDGSQDDADWDHTGDSDVSSDDGESGMDERGKRPDLQLREILFYDDKISIFKARHAQL